MPTKAHLVLSRVIPGGWQTIAMNVEFSEHPAVGDMFAVHRDGPALQAEVAFVRPEDVPRAPRVIAYKQVDRECDALVVATEI